MSDPLEGQELTMLNQLLAQAWPLAKGGDAKAADRVIKIMQLKAKLAGVDFEQKGGLWEG